MKKLVVLALVVVAAVYLNKSLTKARESVVERNTSKTVEKSLEPPTPSGVTQRPLAGDPLEDQLKRIRQKEALADSNSIYRTQCKETREILAGGEVWTTPLGGGKPTGVKITSARMKAEYEEFYRAHCLNTPTIRP